MARTIVIFGTFHLLEAFRFINEAELRKRVQQNFNLLILLFYDINRLKVLNRLQQRFKFAQNKSATRIVSSVGSHKSGRLDVQA